jgi:hypothetical protein
MNCTGREHGLLLNKAYSHLIAALSGRVAVIVLLCAGWIISPPAWSQTCVEDAGQMECTSPHKGAIRYKLIGDGIAFGDAGTSDQDVYSAIYGYGSGWCSETVQPPPYTWTLSQNYFALMGWTTTVHQSAMQSTDACVIQSPASIDWDVTKYLPQSCPDGWSANGTDTATYPTGLFSPPYSTLPSWTAHPMRRRPHRPYKWQ